MKLTEFEKKIHDILDNKEKELEELTSKKEQTKEEITKAKELISKAKKDNDFKGFNKAKQKLWKSENTLEFYQERIEIIKAPTPDKYFSYVDTLDEILEDEINKVLEEAEPVIKQIDELLEKETDIVVRASNLGILMQKELMDNLIISNGRGVEYRVNQIKETQAALDEVLDKHKYPKKQYRNLQR